MTPTRTITVPQEGGHQPGRVVWERLEPGMLERIPPLQELLTLRYLYDVAVCARELLHIARTLAKNRGAHVDDACSDVFTVWSINVAYTVKTVYTTS